MTGDKTKEQNLLFQKIQELVGKKRKQSKMTGNKTKEQNLLFCQFGRAQKREKKQLGKHKSSKRQVGKLATLGLPACQHWKEGRKGGEVEGKSRGSREESEKSPIREFRWNS